MSLLALVPLIAAGASAAELPMQVKKVNPEALKPCDVAGVPGVLAANGVCVKVSGYLSTQFEAGQLKPGYNWGAVK